MLWLGGIVVIMKKFLISLYAASAVAWGVVFAGCQKPSQDDGRLTYVPDPELMDATDAAGVALQAASGLAFSVGDKGTPVFAVDPDTMYRCNPKDPTDCWNDCGETDITFDKESGFIYSVTINIAFPIPENCFQDPARTIEHEMIHSVRRNVDHAGGVHSEHGVFQAQAHPDDLLLEDTSLTLLCEAADCDIFNPETSP